MSTALPCPVCTLYQKKWPDKKCDSCKENDKSQPTDYTRLKKNATVIGVMGIGAVGAVGVATLALPAIGFTAGVTAGIAMNEY